jgi:cell division septal protein FtsQ
LISDKILEIINTSGFIPKSHVLFIDTKNIKGVLSKDFSSISQIDINRSLFRSKISIKIKQFEPYFLWCSGTDCFDMTKDGFVFSKNIYKDDKKIVFYSGDINPISKYILDKDIMNNLVESIEKLDIYGAKVSMIDVSLKNKTKITTSLGNIIVNLGEPLDNQIDSAIIVFNDISKNFNSKVLDYIDVRFGNKVFYK